MEHYEKNVFFSETEIADFYSFVVNKDLENLLIDCDDASIPSPSQIVKKNTTAINQLTRKRPIVETVLELPERNTKSVGKIRRLYETDNFDKFSDTVNENEKFVVKFLNTIELSHDDKKQKHLMEFSKTANPLNRYTWNALRQLNVESNKYPKQYLEINKKKILIGGNRGGMVETIIFNPYLYKRHFKGTPEKSPPKITKPSKQKLIKNMNIVFKPGPLCRKPILNEFSSKSGLGDVQLVKLPSVGLEIIPKIGLPLDSNVCKYLKEVRSKDGSVDSAWANFASSVAPGFTQSSNHENASHVFIIPYENNRSKILMCKDLDVTDNIKPKHKVANRFHTPVIDLDSNLQYLNNYEAKNDVEYVVKSVLSDLLKTTCIGEMQDEIYQIDPDNIEKEENQMPATKQKNNAKGSNRKHINELKKLNVTLIEIDSDASNKSKCTEEFCKLGCVCSSLKSIYLLNEHCGLPQCMLSCKCDLTESSENRNSQTDNEIPHTAVLNIDQHINRHLAKEEIKFRRTVIKSNDGTVVIMGSKRRGTKLPKRFADFDVNDNRSMSCRAEIILPKLPQLNCEPWCMVHNLYRCFCKGLFTNGQEFPIRIYKESVPKITINQTKKTDNTSCARINYIHNTINNKTAKVQKTSDIENTIVIPKNYKIIASTIPGQNSAPISIIKPQSKTGIKNQSLLKKKFNNNIKKDNKSIENSNAENHRGIPANNEVHKEQEIMKDGIITVTMDDLNMINIINNMKDIKNSEKYRLETQIIAPSQGHNIVISWSTLIAQLLLKKIFIWLSPVAPFRQYITLGNIEFHLYKLVNILIADDNLLKNHPPFVSDIKALRHSVNTYLILGGNPKAWQIKATVTNNNQCNASVEKTACNKEIRFNIKDVAKILRSDDKYKVNKWCRICIGNDFKEIKISSKNFTVKNEIIIKAIKICKFKNEMVKVNPCVNDGPFGLYIVPDGYARVYFGPYSPNENPDILLTEPSKKVSKIINSTIRWLNCDDEVVFDALNASSQQENGKSTEIRKNIKIRIETNLTLTCILGIWENFKVRSNNARIQSTTSPVQINGNNSLLKPSLTNGRTLKNNIIRVAEENHTDNDVVIISNNDEIYEISDSD